MFRRVFWFTAGAAAGVWATTRVQRKLRGMAPDALAVRTARRALEAGHRVRDFALDVRAGMAQREAELQDALGLTADPDEPRPLALPAQSARETAPSRRAVARVHSATHDAAHRDPTRPDPRGQTHHDRTGPTGTTGKEDH